LTTLKEIDQLDESKFNTILRPKAKSRPPKDCDILGFDMEWQTDEHGNDNVLSCQLAWYDDSDTLKSRVFQFAVNADRLLRLVE